MVEYLICWRYQFAYSTKKHVFNIPKYSQANVQKFPGNFSILIERREIFLTYNKINHTSTIMYIVCLLLIVIVYNSFSFLSILMVNIHTQKIIRIGKTLLQTYVIIIAYS